ncbi:hypothetical protein PQS91_14120 [Stenotrophomonas geniculata]|uniref:response regulator transcription factor n=1 Tax=Stenotrophomonas geniculata TaxID=86188 RepID=UPI00234F658C|nr:hypothetical protein [Stenotrophomonas geniculata]MDC7800982.1 hypothetical protein [Stenotrophomonas geniculata]
MKILVADDEEPKLASIVDWLSIFFSSSEIVTARSVRSAIDVILDAKPELVLLDMSLPTFDVSPGETGGRPQGFGGIEVLRNLEFYGVDTKVIVITQYEAFHENGRHVDLRLLRERLIRESPGIFVDCVYYNAVSDEWKKELGEYIGWTEGK